MFVSFATVSFDMDDLCREETTEVWSSVVFGNSLVDCCFGFGFMCVSKAGAVLSCSAKSSIVCVRAPLLLISSSDNVFVFVFIIIIIMFLFFICYSGVCVLIYCSVSGTSLDRGGNRFCEGAGGSPFCFFKVLAICIVCSFLLFRRILAFRILAGNLSITSSLISSVKASST